MATEGVYRVADFLDGIRNYRKTGGASGFDLGIPCLSDYYRPQPGYMSIVTGIPGHGKSEVIDWFMVNLSVLYGWKHLLFSPENYPLEQHFVKLAEKYVGKHFLTMGKTDLATAVQWIGDYFTWLYPPEDKTTLEDILDLAQTIHDSEVQGIKGMVLDPWNELDHRRPSNLSETEYISQALSKIRRFARKNNIHVWIVAHPTKLQKDRDTGKYNPPTPYEISGSANWRNKADYCLTVHRPDMDCNKVQVIVNKVKFKSFGKLGTGELDYDFASGRFKDPSFSRYELPKVQDGEVPF